MANNSLYLKALLQVQNENIDIWGSILNVSALQILEDGIAGTGEVDVTSLDQVLDDSPGGPSALGPSPAPNMRFMIMNITGAPGSAKTVTAPARSKVYLAVNNTTTGQVINFIALGGAGVVLAAGEAQWVWCDGTNILPASAATATLAANATNADDSALFDGLDSSVFAQKAVANSFTAGQATERTALVIDVADIKPDPAVSNSFYHLALAPFNVVVQGTPVNGAMFSLIVEQGAGPPHAGTFQAGQFYFLGGTPPTFSTVLAGVDYLAFEYCADITAGPRWIGSIIKGVS